MAAASSYHDPAVMWSDNDQLLGGGKVMTTGLGGKYFTFSLRTSWRSFKVKWASMRR